MRPVAQPGTQRPLLFTSEDRIAAAFVHALQSAARATNDRAHACVARHLTFQHTIHVEAVRHRIHARPGERAGRSVDSYQVPDEYGIGAVEMPEWDLLNT